MTGGLPYYKRRNSERKIGPTVRALAWSAELPKLRDPFMSTSGHWVADGGDAAISGGGGGSGETMPAGTARGRGG